MIACIEELNHSTVVRPEDFLGAFLMREEEGCRFRTTFVILILSLLMNNTSALSSWENS